VKPEWLEDELLAAASDEARVLSIALILMADDYGRGRAAVATVAANAWRYQMEKDDGAHAPEILARASRATRELVEMRFLEVYEVERQRYFQIRNWSKHQKIDRPSKPRIPAPPPPESARVTAQDESLANPSRDTREPLASHSTNTRDRSGPPTSDLDQRPATAIGPADRPPPEPQPAPSAPRASSADADRRDAVVAAWQRGYSRRFERAWALAHSGPQGSHVTALADVALAQRDPLAFVEAALDGYFADEWAVKMRHPVKHLSENAAKYAAARVRPKAAPRPKVREWEPPPPPSAAADVSDAARALLASVGLVRPTGSDT
jgi:hypothetical protein